MSGHVIDEGEVQENKIQCSRMIGRYPVMRYVVQMTNHQTQTRRCCACDRRITFREAARPMMVAR